MVPFALPRYQKIDTPYKLSCLQNGVLISGLLVYTVIVKPSMTFLLSTMVPEIRIAVQVLTVLVGNEQLNAYHNSHLQLYFLKPEFQLFKSRDVSYTVTCNNLI